MSACKHITEEDRRIMMQHPGAVYTAKTRPEDMEKDSPQEHKPLTNGDRIRSMTDEELAGWMNHLFPTLAYEWLLDWLKQEVKDGNG